MSLSERLLQSEITAGLEEMSTEEKAYWLYDRYCDTGCEEYLGDFLLNAEKIGFGIAYNKLVQNTHFLRADFTDYLQDISERFMKKLRKEFKENKRQENIVFTVRSYYSKRAMDICDSLAAKLNGREIESLEKLNEGPDGKPVEKIGDEDKYNNEDLIWAQEKAELSHTIIKMYIENMMASNKMPPHLMALLYARILYQLEMRYDWKRIEAAADKIIAKDHRKISDDEKLVIAFNIAQEPKKPVSPGWAFERMGCQNFYELKNDSEQVIHELFDDSLFWQRPFLENLLQKSACDDALLWKDVVYTEHYNVKQTSAWANSMHNIICDRVMDMIEADDDLDSKVMRLDIPIKTMVKSLGRGEKHVAHNER